MSDSEIFEVDEDDSKVFIPKSKNKANKNKKKAKSGMTEERKAKLLEQLARGRATSALNRQKKAKVKKIKKQDEITEQDEIIYKDIEKKKNKKSKREIELEAQLNALKNKKPLSPIPEEDELFSEGSDMEVILTEPLKKQKEKKQNVKIRFDKKTKRIEDSSDDDEEIEKQIQKLQKRKKSKKPSDSMSVQKPQEPNIKPVVIEKPRKPKAWEIAHLW
tara:strand:- start:1007 stop:1660 length:654 start_codon:yes stop_codon:yes gene_type:complete